MFKHETFFPAKRLRARRLNGNLSQAELASKSGVCVPTISRLETGRSNATKAELEALASALDTTVEDLIGLGEAA
jgi:transcriptional regulator with XRE-family HTH domain